MLKAVSAAVAAAAVAAAAVAAAAVAAVGQSPPAVLEYSALTHSCRLLIYSASPSPHPIQLHSRSAPSL